MGDPPLGLLLDVDGPIASPLTRSLAVPSIARDIVALLAEGVPVVFNTGRSDAFLRAQVVPGLLAAGLGEGAQLHAVCEKGAVWAGIDARGMGEVSIDETLAVPPVCHEVVADLVAGGYGSSMAVDATKRSMATVETHPGVPPREAEAALAGFSGAALAALADAGLGVALGDREVPDATGRVAWRIDPTVIAADVESVAVGKDLGARRALALLEGDPGRPQVPRTWWTVGDSPTDYLMADQLHALGFDVTHVDVRPVLPLAARPYRVLTHPTLTDDAAGAGLLSWLVASLTRDLRSSYPAAGGWTSANAPG